MEQLTKKRNWEELILESDTKVAYELLQAYKEGNIKELGDALEINYKNSITDAHIDLSRHLRYLMEAIIMLKVSEKHKTYEQWEKICKFRGDIEDDLEWNTCLSEKLIKEKWQRAFKMAKDINSTYAEEASKIQELTWKDVFEQSYHPKNYGK